MRVPSRSALLTTAEMGEADRLAIAGGVPGIDLMEAAGRAAARAIQRRFPPVPVLVLCGPGNNGGDGFVVARLLRAAGWPVSVGTLGDPGRLRGDAALAATRWDGGTRPAAAAPIGAAGLVVDALFGAGLSRDLSGEALALVAALRGRAGAGRPGVVAIDTPSGVDGDTGLVRGAAAPADLTVAFFRAKPGHLLLPGRELCGETVVADIGIPDSALEAIAPAQGRNGPALWAEWLRPPGPGDHKYTRGHAAIAGGAAMTGAARLAAAAARRAGAGLATLAVPPAAAAIYRAAAPGAPVVECAGAAAFRAMLADRRLTAVLAGPGLGVEPRTRAIVEAALGAGRPAVLDADALTVFAGEAGALAALAGPRRAPPVVTPHEGEFARLFPDLAAGAPGASRLGKLDRARAAAARLGAVVLLKGADTVIAAPDGTALIDANAPPWLATGGTGDVLAGTVAGLLARGTPAFEAAAAAAWLCGTAARLAGPGLLAEDLPPLLPRAAERAREAAAAGRAGGFA